jgi:hypothetical protein
VTLKKHVNVNHFIIAKMFEKEMNDPLRGKVEKQIYQKEIKSINNPTIFFFAAIDPF